MKILIIILVVIIFVLYKLANKCFDDEDPDLDWYNNYAKQNCPHEGEKTDVIIDSAVTCEVIHTICDDCSQVLNVKIEC